MAKGIIILFLIFLIILAGVIFAYFNYQKPLEEEISQSFYNVSVKAWEGNEQGEKIKSVSTGIIFVLNSDEKSIYQQVITEEGIGEYVQIKVPINETFLVFNYNLENQTYYTIRKIYLFDKPNQNLRIDINLEKMGSLDIKTEKINETLSYITLKSIGKVRFINFCVRWSPGIITVGTSPDFIEENPPTRLTGKVDKCYITLNSLINNGQQLTIPISYRIWDNSIINTIDVYLMDGDIRFYSINESNNGLDSYIIEENGQDIGIEDVKITLEI